MSESVFEKTEAKFAKVTADLLLASQSTQRITSFVIVEDHPLVRESLKSRLNMRLDWQVFGEAETDAEAMEVIERVQPDIALVDIYLKGGNGLALVKQVRKCFPQIKVLVISGYNGLYHVVQAKKAGAHGFMDKREAIPKLITAIDCLQRDESFFTAELSEKLVASSPRLRLSPREMEIFRMIGNGMPSGAIAKTLFLSSHTIDTHRENIKRKIGAKNAAELIRMAVLWVKDMHESATDAGPIP